MAMSNVLTCNQVMILLDCHRGTFNTDRHMGGVEEDLRRLESNSLIEKSEYWELTTNGKKLIEHLLAQATWRLEFVPGE